VPAKQQDAAETPRWSARALVLAWSAPVVFATPFVVLSMRAGGQTVAFWRVALIVAATWYVWAAMTPVIVRLADRVRLERPIRASVIALHLTAAFLACVVQALSAAIAIELLVPAPGATFAQVFVYWLLLLLPAGVVVYSAVVGFRTAELNRAESIAKERQAQRLAAQLSEAQLAALRSQIQPHFLFNALNAVIALVRDHETENAVEALTTLSALLRTALRTGATHETKLCEEIAFTTNYVAMERLRFGDRVRLNVDVPQSLGDARVPTFLLQPFVENALRHGLRDHRERLRVDISARREDGRLRVLVEDDGAGLAADWEARSANGFGISNSRARLRQLYGADASLAITSHSDPDRTSVAIALPYREGPPVTPAANEPA
jgi:sensor histidine kinase YesM